MLADFRDHASPLRIMQEDHYEKTLSEPKMREVRNAEHDRLQDFPVFQITHGYATTISTSVHSYAAGPSSSCAALLHTAETGRLPRIIVMIWAYNGIYIAAFGGCRLPSHRATEDMLVLAKAFQAYKEQVLAP